MTAVDEPFRRAPTQSPAIHVPELSSQDHGAVSALIVDDSENDALLNARTLRAAGYVVRSRHVSTAEELRSALTEERWDIVLCDHVMPGLDTFGALRILRESDQETPLIVVSGAIGEETAVATIRAGAADYVSKDRLGRLGAIVKVQLQDVAERRARMLAEAALLESETRFESVFEEAPVGVALLDLTNPGRFLRVNRALCDVLERTREELVRTSVQAVIHPEDLAHGGQGLDALILDEAPVDRREIRLLKPSGDAIWILFSASAVRESPRSPHYAVAHFVDISEQKRDEQELQHLAD